MTRKPVIGITMGDPSGIGPEIIVKALSHKNIYTQCHPIVIGEQHILSRALSYCKKSQLLRIHPISSPDDALFHFGTIDVLSLDEQSLLSIPPGTLSKECGNAAFQYVKTVISLALSHKLDATVTTPLNKEALHMAGCPFAGHTEIYAHYTNTDKYTMMLIHDNLRVIHVSTHVSLREACNLVKKKRVLEMIHIAHNACIQMGILHPKIGVAGLNPHCGENGLFGTEELEEIQPAIREALSEGIDVEGPVSPDTIFSKAKGNWYDIVVAMYHDQGHIPLKMAGFVYDSTTQKWKTVSGVNITLGLPIIRTSVDHGTAFDLAGTGTASEDSLINALTYAVRFATQATL